MRRIHFPPPNDVNAILSVPAIGCRRCRTFLGTQVPSRRLLGPGAGDL